MASGPMTRIQKLPQRWLRWLPLVVIVAAAIWVRWPMLPQLGYRYDSYENQSWTMRAVNGGLFAAYIMPASIEDGQEIDHPPVDVSLMALGGKLFEDNGGDLTTKLETANNPDLVRILKIPTFIFDLLLVVAGYAFVVGEAGVAWAVLVSAALAFTPGLLADSAWWGQTDVISTFFLVVTVYALHKRWTTTAWVFYAVTMLSKFQAIPLLPLLIVLTWRRSTHRVFFRSVLIAAVIIAVVLLPFILGSGFSAALRPYLEGPTKYPFVTVQADNFWYWSLYSSRNMEAAWFQMPPDTEATWGVGVFWGPISARDVGYAMFGLCALLISLRAWIDPERDDEFLLATGLLAAFFMFSTQMHERYLYPALVLAIFAMVKHRWLWLLWIGFGATVTYNIVRVAAHDKPPWDAVWAAMPWSTLENARFNVILTVILLGLILAPLYRFSHLPKINPATQRVLFTVGALALVLMEIGLRLGPERQ